MLWWKLRRRVHVSWLVAGLSFGVVVGVIISQHVPFGWFYSLVWPIAAIVLATLMFWRRRAYMLAVIFVAGGVIGLWRGSIEQRNLTPYKKLIGHELTVRGTVSDDAGAGKHGEIILRLTDIAANDHPLSGKLWISLDAKKAAIKRGDTVTVRGKLSEGFGSFAASMYRAELVKTERPQPGDPALAARDAFAAKVREGIDEPQASLGIGFLTGQRRTLPEALENSLRIAGLMHIVVASGYNLTILVRLARRLFARFSKYLAALSAGSLVAGFIAVTGLSPSMARAGLVAGLSLLAWYYGRKIHPLVLLPFAAAVTLLVSPSYGWNDLGWQLSFAAFAGVMIVAPLAQKYFFGDEQPGIIRQIVGETLAAWICTLPILVLAFGQFSNVAIIANVLVLPFLPLAMLLTFIAGIGAIVVPGLAHVIAAPASWLLEYMTWVAQQLAHVPWAQTQLKANVIAVAAAYILLAGFCLYAWRKTGYGLRDSSIVE